jgi:DNA-binding beta-propeller fold protein YncE
MARESDAIGQLRAARPDHLDAYDEATRDRVLQRVWLTADISPVPPRTARTQQSWLVVPAKRRGRLMIAVAATAAVTVVAALAIVIPLALHSGSAGPAPTGPTVSGPTLYVGTWRGTVVPINIATGKVLTPITLPAQGRVDDMALARDGRLLCVLSSGAHTDYLTRIDVATGRALRPVTVPIASSSVSVTPDGRTAYLVEDPVGDNPGGVLPVNILNGTVDRQIRVPGAYELAIAPDGQRLYVSASPHLSAGGRAGHQRIVPIDTDTNTAQAPIRLRAPGYAYGIAISPDGSTVYVATVWEDGHQAAVTPIRTATDIALKPIPVAQGSSADLSIAIAPNGRIGYAYGTDQTISPINLATNTALKPIRLAVPPDVAFGFQIPAGSRYGYATFASHTVSPVDLATSKLLAPITVTRRPYTGVYTLASYGGSLYVGTGYGKALVGHGKVSFQNAHVAVSVVQLATGKIRIIKIPGLPTDPPVPTYALIAP